MKTAVDGRRRAHPYWRARPSGRQGRKNMTTTATSLAAASAAGQPVTLFYSYAHEDEALRDELQGHLKILERRGLLAPWHDRKIVAGQDWAGEIDSNLR